MLVKFSVSFKPTHFHIELYVFFRSYFIVASRMVRPGQLYRVAVSLLKETHPITVRASIQRNGVEMSSDNKDCKEGIMETLLMRVSTN